jgi:hypothetical protein
MDPVKNLPSNIVAGFDNVFKFASLESDSGRIATTSLSAMAQCNYDPTATTIGGGQRGCPTTSNPYTNSSTVDTTANKDEITGIFTNTLGTVTRVTNDPYFGTPDLQPTADSLNDILSSVNSISASMSCTQAVVTYCAMWDNSNGIIDGMSSVNSAIDKFKNGDETKSWEDHADIFTFLHVLPYFSLIALAFFTFFHYKGGVCCCCHGGSKCACLALIPFMLFWLVAFIIFLVVMAVGTATIIAADEIYVDELNNRPSVSQIVDHLQTAFPEFWDLVFEDLVKGLKITWVASIMFTINHLLILLYTCCECCCRPFKKDEEAPQASS